MKILVHTNSLFWATALAGAVKSAKEFIPKEINPNFKFALTTDRECIKPISEIFDKPDNTFTEYVLPDEKEFPVLDNFDFQEQKLLLQERHSLLIDDNAPALGYDKLASAWLKRTFKLYNEPGYFYPEIKSNVKYDLVVSDKEFIEKGEWFCEAADLPSTKILVITEDNILEAIKAAINGISLYVGEMTDEYCTILKSLYKGYDKMTEAIPMLLLITDSLVLGRENISWMAQVPAHETETKEMIEQKGQVYKTRKSFNFDHHAYEKERAKSAMQTM